MNNKEENSYDFYLDFVQEFGLCTNCGEHGTHVQKTTMNLLAVDNEMEPRIFLYTPYLNASTL